MRRVPPGLLSVLAASAMLGAEPDNRRVGPAPVPTDVAPPGGTKPGRRPGQRKRKPQGRPQGSGRPAPVATMTRQAMRRLAREEAKRGHHR